MIDLDRVSSEIVLRNLRAALRVDWSGLVSELRRIGPCTLADFLAETGLGLDDIYRRRRGGWAGMKRQAGLESRPVGPDDAALAGAFGRLLHIDDPDRLREYASLLSVDTADLVGDARRSRLALMLHFALWGAGVPADDLATSRSRAASDEVRAGELRELLEVLARDRRRVVAPFDPAGAVPLHVHARYSRDEALSAFGVTNPGSVRQGVKWIESEQADLFFVTLRKTERHYSPTTMYQDRAISPTLFRESQSLTTEASPTGQRYINHARNGSSVHLFVRESKEEDGDMGAPPYFYAFPMTYVSHTGERPMRILWHLTHELPADIFHAARIAVG